MPQLIESDVAEALCGTKPTFGFTVWWQREAAIPKGRRCYLCRRQGGVKPNGLGVIGI